MRGVCCSRGAVDPLSLNFSVRRRPSMCVFRIPHSVSTSSLYPAKRTMSSTDDQQSSISSLLRDADILKDQFSGYPNSTGDEYQKKLDLAIKKYQQCKDLVARASLLSLNEPLEDLATSNMRWATTDGVPSSCYSF